MRVGRVRVVEVFHRERFDSSFDILAPQTETERCVQTVDDVEVMGPAFGPILPRMDGRVG